MKRPSRRLGLIVIGALGVLGMVALTADDGFLRALTVVVPVLAAMIVICELFYTFENYAIFHADRLDIGRRDWMAKRTLKRSIPYRSLLGVCITDDGTLTIEAFAEIADRREPREISIEPAEPRRVAEEIQSRVAITEGRTIEVVSV